jgi:hypothetical protein
VSAALLVFHISEVHGVNSEYSQYPKWAASNRHRDRFGASPCDKASDVCNEQLSGVATSFSTAWEPGSDRSVRVKSETLIAEDGRVATGIFL